MSKVFEHYLEEAEKTMDVILTSFKEGEITKEQAVLQILANKNIKICILDGLSMDTKSAINELLDAPENMPDRSKDPFENEDEYNNITNPGEPNF
tara:strand:- start:866 stop:1150 length:285 start_codon:yes stop_codon:yes gene_type:complete